MLYLKLSYFKGITFDDANFEAPIQQLEEEFGHINFVDILANNQDRNIQEKEKHDKEKHMLKLKKNKSYMMELWSISSEDDESEESMWSEDINQKDVDTQFHASDFDRNSHFNYDLWKESNKEMEPLEMQNHDSDERSSQPLDRMSSQSISYRVKYLDTQFHASDFDRNSHFNYDLWKESNKEMEPLEMQNHDSDERSSQPLDRMSSQSISYREIDTSADKELTIIKLSNLQTHTLVNNQVLNQVIIQDTI